jgi:hypothetical protein
MKTTQITEAYLRRQIQNLRSHQLFAMNLYGEFVSGYVRNDANF